MSITNITPREQELEQRLALMTIDRDLWRREAQHQGNQVQHLERMLDETRTLIRDMDRKILRGGK